MCGYFVNQGTLHKNPPKCNATPSGAVRETIPDGHFDKCNICFEGHTSF